MTFQLGMPMIPGLTSKVFATDMTIPVETEKVQATVDEEGTTELSESADITETEEISRNYEIKDEETWDISANGDGSVIAKWTLNDKTLSRAPLVAKEAVNEGGFFSQLWDKATQSGVRSL